MLPLQRWISRFTQPLPVALGLNAKPLQYFILMEYRSILAGKSIVEAFDKLFKLHYVLDVNFAT